MFRVLQNAVGEFTLHADHEVEEPGLGFRNGLVGRLSPNPQSVEAPLV